MPLYAIDDLRPTLADDGSVWIAPSAELIGDVRVAAEVSIWFGAILRADNSAIRIGARSNVQDGAVLHCDPDAPLQIGEDCTVGHRAILHGCTLGDRVLIGMGATVLNHARIGDDCLVGANALVTEGKVFEPGSLIVGAPAKAIRQLSPEAIAGLKAAAADYAGKRAVYGSGLRRLA